MIELVIDQRRRNIGSFEVGRVLPFAKRRMVGPFIFFDHMGPVDLPRGLAREAGVLPPPHVGLELGARIALPRGMQSIVRYAFYGVQASAMRDFVVASSRIPLLLLQWFIRSARRTCQSFI